MALSVNVALVAQAPSDPYYADSLQQWEQGRFIHFHGLAQWVGWLWPFAAGARCSGASRAATRRGPADRPGPVRTLAARPPGLPTMHAMYYKHHIFFCLNERKPGEDSCALVGAQAGFDHCKSRIKSAGLAGPGGIRVNKAGCLDRCAGGPVAVVYPDETWYTFVDKSDIDEIVDSHLVGGKPVERLLLPPDIGR